MAAPSKLLILDLNGLICHKDREHPVDEQNKLGPHDDFYQFKVYRVLSRPHFLEFFTRLFDNNYEVALWTSTTEYNGKRIIEWMIPQIIQNKFKFIWYRDRTRLDPDFGTNEEITQYDTVKNLQDVWSHPYVNGYRRFNALNTCIVDDGPHKMRFNAPDNVILVSDISFDDENWVQLTVDAIEQRFSMLDLSNTMNDMNLTNGMSDMEF